jgi:3-hydroxyethyl bacteriochlorophyllide a dehydrogenase
VEPLAFAGLVLTQVGYNCGARAPLAVGDGCAVLGDGMVGLWSAQTLAWRGAETVLIGHHADRLARFPAGLLRHPFNARETDWIVAIRQLLPAGIQVLVDTIGSTESVEALIPLMRRHGHIVSAGFYGTADRLALQLLRAGELSVDMVSGWSWERMNATRELIAAGYLQTLPLITHHFPVQQAAEAWRLIAAKGDSVMGVILDW